MEYIPVIGLEIHVELGTKSKMFCSCKNDAEEKEPNTNICPVCLGHPGTLPVINKEGLKRVIRVGYAMNSEIAKETYFDRKSYFYPDLPKGYQISQKYAPICKGGYMKISENRVGITEIHLEEDTCRLSHEVDKESSLVDCNRAGVPLMELVTDPDIKSASGAKEFAKELQLILRYMDISNADMEKGQMRIEANISLSKQEGVLGTKVEIKNINSFKAVERAINQEIKRQTEILEKGEEVIQETRGWDSDSQKTVLQRKKETAFDYRYFPEPDLPLIKFDKEYLNQIKRSIPELPEKKRIRFMKEYTSLSHKDVCILVQSRSLASYFENIVSELPSRLEREELDRIVKLSFNYLVTDLLGLVGVNTKFNREFKITPENFAELITMIFKEEISSKIAKQTLKIMLEAGADPSQIIDENGWRQTSDLVEIKAIAEKVISQNLKAVQDFRSGKAGALQFLVGRIMAESRGKANPQIAQRFLEEFLK